MRCSELAIVDDGGKQAMTLAEVRRGPVLDAWLALSPEVTLGFGGSDFVGAAMADGLHPLGIVLIFGTGRDARAASLHIVDSDNAKDALEQSGSGQVVVCSATREFMASMGFGGFTLSDRRGYYQLPEMRMLAEAGLGVPFAGRVADVYRAAKGMELICETLRHRGAGTLIPLAAHADLSMADSMRIFAAKDFISERFREKLTLEGIGRACGINRAKLTRGFREVFHCSIADTIAEHRLAYAGRQLTGSEKAISSIGYEAGYLNNASFARAFNRRFECTPSEFRARARRRSCSNRNLLAA